MLASSSVSRALKPGAPFLFTAAEVPDVATGDTGITGTMNDVTFRYWAVASIRTLAAECGFVIERVSEDAGANTWYFARRAG